MLTQRNEASPWRQLSVLHGNMSLGMFLQRWLSEAAENNFFQWFLLSVFPYVQKLQSKAESNIETEQFSPFSFLEKTDIVQIYLRNVKGI